MLKTFTSLPVLKKIGLVLTAVLVGLATAAAALLQNEATNSQQKPLTVTDSKKILGADTGQKIKLIVTTQTLTETEAIPYVSLN